MNKVRVLLMVDWFAPGFKAGGPIRSAVNFSDQLEHDLDIYILTTDRDLGDHTSYKNIVADRWTKEREHHIYYASPSSLTWRKILWLIRESNADYIYLNSMYSRYFSIYPMLMKRLGMLGSKIILAPRGMLKNSALENKAAKKKIFLNLFKRMGFQDKLIFHATDDTEEKDIATHFGKKVTIFKTGNLPGKQTGFIPPSGKSAGELKIIFVGRIHPIKNLEFLLNLLKRVKGKVELTVIATLEDKTYWALCNDIISTLPAGITVTFLQDVPNDKIADLIRQHHIFALPTLGENFGHSIFESLAVGRPVLISDQSPWRDLMEVKAGWDIPLHDINKFESTISQAVNMDNDELTLWCQGAWNHAHSYLHSSSLRQSYLKLFS